MARRKRRTTNSNNRSKSMKNTQRQNINLIVIGIIIFSVLLAVLLYTNSGVVGQKLNEILGGMLGIVKYILPIGTFLAAIKIASSDEYDTTSKLLQYVLFLICIAVIMSIFEIWNGNIETIGDLSQNLKKAYTLGTGNIGGGAIGTLAAISLVNMLGKFGALILSIGVTIMIFAFIYGIDIAEFINRKSEEHKELKEERRKNREELIYQQRKVNHQKKEEPKKHTNEEIYAIQDVQNQRIEPEQIKINLNGRVVENEEHGTGKRIGRIFKRIKTEGSENITDEANNIMNMEDNTEEDPNNLFVQEEEQKEDKTKQVLQLEHTISVEDDNYVFPPISFLSEAEKPALKGGTKTLKDTAAKLQKTLYSFGVSAKVENVTVGPAITRYELKPAEGVRVSKIANLADDIALNLAAETIRIEAPIPGKQAVGIEVPNKEKEMVSLREVIESDSFANNKSKLSVALGKDVGGEAAIADIAKMPHVLIAGATGSRKISLYKYNYYKYYI